ncbi:hypothetical protein OJ997_20460 [Solirubrobacter phytolaccae]|uniref:Uncharacterized protein n=1 Tax=Solirubrobacter phytolaccae TaxID=1404360 RepID=A0A9X3NER2_9ACTN|nr:hypothetical protein [Solirubrobacter phytolaccae]MDA0182696.1 hypothetical protein [Solirubrobacter phytolaccae]
MRAASSAARATSSERPTAKKTSDTAITAAIPTSDSATPSPTVLSPHSTHTTMPVTIIVRAAATQVRMA